MADVQDAGEAGRSGGASAAIGLSVGRQQLICRSAFLTPHFLKSRYLNNRIERDHRRIKRRIRSIARLGGERRGDPVRHRGGPHDAQKTGEICLQAGPVNCRAIRNARCLVWAHGRRSSRPISGIATEPVEAALEAMRAHDAIETAPPGWCRALDEVTAATVAHMMTDGISAT